MSENFWSSRRKSFSTIKQPRVKEVIMFSRIPGGSRVDGTSWVDSEYFRVTQSIPSLT